MKCGKLVKNRSDTIAGSPQDISVCNLSYIIAGT
jgi:hypothetical protein